MRNWTKLLLGLVVAVTFATTAGAATLTLTLNVPGSMPLPGEEFTVEIWAQAEGTGDYGIRGLAWSVTTPDTIDMAEPKIVTMAGFPPWTGPAHETLPEPIPQNHMLSKGKPTEMDWDGDGDQDVYNQSFFDITLAASYYWVGHAGGGLAVPHLVGTQTWIIDPEAPAGTVITLGLETNGSPTYYDLGNPGEGYQSLFDTVDVEGGSVTIGGGGTVTEDPTANPNGPYGEDDWDPTSGSGWNNPTRWIVLDGSASHDNDGEGALPEIVNYIWEIAQPMFDGQDWGYGPLVNLGHDGEENPTITIAELEGLFGAGSLPDPYAEAEGPGPEHIYLLSLTVIDNDGETNTAQTDLFVPEPATLALLAFGGLAALRRRRRA